MLIIQSYVFIIGCKNYQEYIEYQIKYEKIYL